MNDEKLLSCATEFVVFWHEHRIHISRYSNHMTLGTEWSVCKWWGAPYNSYTTNPFYLGSDGVWRYKHGCTFKTARAALEALEKRACVPGTNGWAQIAEDAHEPYVPAEVS